MKRFAGAFILIALGSSAALAQNTAVPTKWLGTWVLNVPKSTFEAILLPGVPAGLTIVSQTLRIQSGAGTIRLSGDSIVADSGKSYPNHDDNSLSLDGKETVVGPISLSFRRKDDSNFEIVSKASLGDRNFGEVSRFSFSPDGKTLTETKTQTERAPGSDGVVIRTSTSVLLFDKLVDQVFDKFLNQEQKK